jgi:predicted anti-sigma-YlaC factor YlaD
MMLGTCQEIVDRVSAILDGEAGVIERAKFHAHIAMCSDCSRYLDQFRLVKRASSQVTPADLPTDFSAVMEFVLKEVSTG